MTGKEIERFIETTRNIIPGCNIIMNELLPRYHRNLMARQDYEEKRIECNQIISEFLTHMEFILSVIRIYPNCISLMGFT
jgi:hypothetical protein